MGWFNNKIGDIPGGDFHGDRFRLAVARYERMIEHFAAQHDTLGKEGLEDLYQFGMQELWSAVTSCVCEHPGALHHDPSCLCGEGSHCLRSTPAKWGARGLLRPAKQCACTELRYLDPLSTSFEKWFKTRLGHRLIDRVAMFKPRRGPARERTYEQPFLCRVLRRARGLDLLGLDHVVRVMNIRYAGRDFAEGQDFEIVDGRIRWLTAGPPVWAHYEVEGTRLVTETVPVSVGRRDPRLEVPDTVWENFGPRQAEPSLQLADHQISPEEHFEAKERLEIYEYFMERLTVRLTRDEARLLSALASDTLDNAESPKRRLMKALGVTRKQLDQVLLQLRLAVREVETEMLAEGLEVGDLARCFLVYSGRG